MTVIYTGKPSKRVDLFDLRINYEMPTFFEGVVVEPSRGLDFVIEIKRDGVSRFYHGQTIFSQRPGEVSLSSWRRVQRLIDGGFFKHMYQNGPA